MQPFFRLLGFFLLMGMACAGCQRAAPEPPVRDQLDGPTYSQVIFLPDGKQLLSSADDWREWSSDLDQGIVLWDVATGNKVRVMEDSEKLAKHFACEVLTVSADGKLALGGGRGSLCLWELSTGKVLRAWDSGENDACAVALSPDSRLALSGGHGGEDGEPVKLWNAATGKLVRILYGPKQPVYSVAFSPDGKLAAAEYIDAVVRLWDVASGAPVRTLPAQVPADSGGWLRFSGDGKLLFSRWLSLRTWEVASGKLIQSLRAPVRMVGMGYSPDGKLCLAGKEDTELVLWDVATRKALRTFQPGKGWPAEVSVVEFSPDGQLAAVGTRGGRLRLWEVATGRAVRDFAFEQVRATGSHFSPPETSP